MSWATTFNSGAIGNNLSSKMANIKLDTSVDTAEIQAKINEHFKPVQTTGQTTNAQNNVQMQPQTSFNGGIQQDTFAQNQQMMQNQTFTPYQPQMPNYQNVPYNAGVQYTGQNVQYYQPVYSQTQAYYPQTATYSMPINQYQAVQNTQTYIPQQTETAYSQNMSETVSATGQSLNTDTASYVPNFNGASEGGIEKLQATYTETKASQGIISKGIDAVKSLFSISGTSKSANKALEKYQNGTISYSEAMKEIENFKEQSKTSTEAITTAISAVSSFVGASFIKAKGGTTAKMLALAVGLGAGIKTLMGIGERSTNQVAGDALDAVNLAKDMAQGSINGAITGGATIIASNPTKISSTSSGALTGAISGSAMGVVDYSINCIHNDEEFSINDMLSQSIKYGLGGALIGAGTGAATGKILNKNGYSAAQTAEDVKNATSAIKPASAANTQPVTFESIDTAMKTNRKGNFSSQEVIDDCTEALQKAIKLEDDAEIISLYDKFQNATNDKEKLSALNKMYKKLAAKYHPDANNTESAKSAWQLYSDIFGTKGNTGGKKALLYYYTDLAKGIAA